MYIYENQFNRITTQTSRFTVTVHIWRILENMRRQTSTSYKLKYYVLTYVHISNSIINNNCNNINSSTSTYSKKQHEIVNIVTKQTYQRISKYVKIYVLCIYFCAPRSLKVFLIFWLVVLFCLLITIIICTDILYFRGKKCNIFLDLHIMCIWNIVLWYMGEYITLGKVHIYAV